MTQDYYKTLNISPSANITEVKQAFHHQMFKLKKHPDLGGSPSEAKEIVEAYNVLSDASKRAAYDTRHLKNKVKKTIIQRLMKRKHERRTFKLNLTMSKDSLVDKKAKAIDFSPSGLQLLTSLKVKKGDLITLDSETFHSRCEVVWVGTVNIGVQFRSFTSKKRSSFVNIRT